MSDRQDRRRIKNSRSKVRKAAQAAGFRSAFEQRVADSLTIGWEFEPDSFSYEVRDIRRYTPDFKLENGVYLECKGRLTAADRRKLLEVRAQNPQIDLRLVFMYPNNKLSARSKTRYWEWAEKNGFLWCGPEVPKEWL